MIPTLQSIRSLRLMNCLKSSLLSRNGTGLTLFPTTRNAMAKLSNLYSVMVNAMFQLTVPVLSAMLLTTTSCGMMAKNRVSFYAKSVSLYSLWLPKADSLRYTSLDVLIVTMLSFIRKTASTLSFTNALIKSVLITLKT